ncbi:MAG: GTP-binding protein [Bacteroidales bacterium]|nr:GTP-binding protein [Bacteroidales bacterium]
MKFKQVPVLLLTGYLGSGKTTLLNRILTNEKGIRFAVIVNDIGEVNIDADLIQKGGVVGQSDDSLVALQNGCICCTLKMDLIQQLTDLVNQSRFDYIVIEASGVCEPGPIAQTICSIPGVVSEEALKGGIPVLDCIATVVDSLRMKDEFQGGESLTRQNLDEDDIENLLIQQVEFCNMVLLNKASEVTKEELRRLHEIIRALQPKAKIVECDYCNIPLEELINTRMFDFDSVATSATWIQKVEGELDEDAEIQEHHHHDDDDDDDHDHHHHHHHDDDDDDDDDEHEHHHHHHHHHLDGEGEAEEYGFVTYVYYARQPIILGLFDDFVARRWPKNIIRAKGICYFSDEQDVCYVFEQAGRQTTVRNAGNWFATMPKRELEMMLERDANLRRDWDEFYGDRMQKIVFIGQNLDKALIKKEMDACLVQ